MLQQSIAWKSVHPKIFTPISSTSARYHAWHDFQGDRLLWQLLRVLVLHLGLLLKGVWSCGTVPWQF